MTAPASSEAPPDDVVTRVVAKGVALLTLNRPDRMNAWTPAMEERYFDLLDEADADPDVRAIVVTGAGRGFCAGADMANLRDRSAGAPPRVRTGRPLTHALSLRKPMVAAINGGCAGIGLLQALLCDVRFAARDAKIATSFARRGIVAEFGVSWILQRLVGPGRAADLLLSGRSVDGGEALSMGLVNGVEQTPEATVATAIAYAETLATNCSPTAMAWIKGQLADDWFRTRADSERDAAELLSRPELAADVREGVASFVERRDPAFPPLAAKAH